MTKLIKSAAKEFNTGDIIDTQGNSNMADRAMITEIIGNTLKFTDSKGTKFQGIQRSRVRRLIAGGDWKIISKATAIYKIKI